jgi:Protein of unknown function (DUF2934)
MSHTSTVTGSKSSSARAGAKKRSSRGPAGQSASPGGNTGDGMDREQMVAVAAYFHAEHRGFDGGDPLADWLAAEAEIDAMLDNSQEVIQ